MTVEDKLKAFILEKYPTVKDFCDVAKISSSTIFTVFKRGVNNSSTKTILKICRSLSIDPDALYTGEITPKFSKQAEYIDIYDFISSISTMELSHNGIPLTGQEKRIIMSAMKFALSMKNIDQ